MEYGQGFVPKVVALSLVDTLVYVDKDRLIDNAGRELTKEQLGEVVAVYNAWRVGNLQDCTIRRDHNGEVE